MIEPPDWWNSKHFLLILKYDDKDYSFLMSFYYENIYLLKSDKLFFITKLYFHFFIDADVILEHFYTNSLLVIPAENQTLYKSYAGVGERDLFL